MYTYARTARNIGTIVSKTINQEEFAMLRALKIEPEKCTGCLQCELACSLENEGVMNPAKSRIKVFTFHQEGRFFALYLHAM